MTESEKKIAATRFENRLKSHGSFFLMMLEAFFSDPSGLPKGTSGAKVTVRSRIWAFFERKRAQWR